MRRRRRRRCGRRNSRVGRGRNVWTYATRRYRRRHFKSIRGTEVIAGRPADAPRSARPDGIRLPAAAQLGRGAELLCAPFIAPGELARARGRASCRRREAVERRGGVDCAGPWPSPVRERERSSGHVLAAESASVSADVSSCRQLVRPTRHDAAAAAAAAGHRAR